MFVLFALFDFRRSSVNIKQLYAWKKRAFMPQQGYSGFFFPAFWHHEKNTTAIIGVIAGLIIMVKACNQRKSRVPDQCNKKELTKCFINEEWKQGWNACPDGLVKHHHYHSVLEKNIMFLTNDAKNYRIASTGKVFPVFSGRCALTDGQCNGKSNSQKSRSKIKIN